MNTLTEEELQDFFNERAAKGNQKGAGGLAPKTLANMRNMMHLAFSQAVKNKLLQENLVESVRLPKVEKYEMRVMNREEQRRFILAAKMAPEPAAFGVIFDLFMGLRIGELCGLRWENVDMANCMIKVREIRNRLPNHDDTVRASTSVPAWKSWGRSTRTHQLHTIRSRGSRSARKARLLDLRCGCSFESKPLPIASARQKRNENKHQISITEKYL